METRNSLRKPGVQPCYKCPDRAVGCHSTCPKYLEWKKSYDEVVAREDDIKRRYSNEFTRKNLDNYERLRDRDRKS